jgi:mycofactocin precursor
MEAGNQAIGRFHDRRSAFESSGSNQPCSTKREVTILEDRSVENKKEVPEDTNPKTEDPVIMEEIVIEELGVDGICGVY